MKLKGVFLAGVAIVTLGFASSSQAAERLSLYEINSFVAEMANSINNPNPYVARSFMERSVDKNASFQDTMSSAWYDGRYYQAWNGHYASPYYRYPYYSGYMVPTSFKAVGRTDMISRVEHKKSVVPRYHQTMDVLGTQMPADATSAMVDVRLKEYGLSYGMSPYGTHYGQKVQHADSRCQLNLKKKNGTVMLTRMTCNTLQNLPL